MGVPPPPAFVPVDKESRDNSNYFDTVAIANVEWQLLDRYGFSQFHVIPSLLSNQEEMSQGVKIV